MTFSLSPLASQSGYRLESFETVGSTNAVALERAQAGDAGKLWLVSKKQESGRGRRGRVWSTPSGNLAATLLLVERYEPTIAATLGFVAGLALGDALQAVVPDAAVAVGLDGASKGRDRFELKWPNDVLADGSKLSGILLESILLPDGRFALAIGIGVNVVSHPEDLPYPATSLKALGSRCDAETLFLALSDSWRENCALWNEGRGLKHIRARWLERAAGLGGEVAVRVEDRVISGIFETIDEDCRFVIRDSDGARIRIDAGDVHFGAVASARAI
ncbi:biotin--[acetyl-CoA-carboxylase] ligase [Brucella endophytica]|uniref:biotin--[biotin carboxyl-carrier protein] ligase n=1 Tax=Brucella endophytica TaxID=1963359 RepID=A0A916SS19_9HYPH|nr:biotin--[acetyl-CoA-carboxylase] ligase [Brucella endophytica]GGB10472.1 biotin--[acetyl-CoA-carboxylase] ligase [Brucella endophytica]